MRSRWLTLTLAAAFATPALVHAQTNPCATQMCSVIFDWSNGGTAPDVDRKYGSPSELEASLVRGLTNAGFHLTSSGQASSMTITVRLTPKNRSLCDTMPGVNPDYSCHTVDRASIVFTPNDSTQHGLPRLDVNPRCSDPKNDPTFAQFGQYAADLLIYTVVEGGKGSRPRVTCR